MNFKEVSRLISYKKRNVIFIITALVVLFTIVLEIVLLFLFNEYSQFEKNFKNNDRVKIIEIDKKIGKNKNELLELTEKDYEVLKNDKKLNEKGDISALYRLKFGVGNDYIEENMFISAYDGNITKKILQNQEIKSGVLYPLNEIKKDKIALKVPIINVTKAGYTADEEKDFVFDIDNSRKNNPENIKDVNEDIIISVGDFKKIIETVRADEEFLSNIIITVNHIEDVDEVAEKVKQLGYSAEYAFQYFENLSENLKKQTIITLSIGITFILSMLIIVILLFKNIINNSAGDMSVLKYMGISVRNILKIYMRPINRIAMATLFVNVIFVTITRTFVFDVIMSKIFIILLIDGILLSTILIYTRLKIVNIAQNTPIYIRKNIKTEE